MKRPLANEPETLHARNGISSAPTCPDDVYSDDEFEQGAFFASTETTAFIGSTLVHLIAILSLALIPLAMSVNEDAVVLVSPQREELINKVELIEEVNYSEMAEEEIGASLSDETDMANASAVVFAEVAEIPSPVELEPSLSGQIMVNKIFSPAVAPLAKIENQKGSVGQGTGGAAGAVDRITFEIIQALEERPTLVVWLFDQSGSLHRQRQEIRNRFDHIYNELGIIRNSGAKAFTREQEEIPLLTSIIGFGNQVTQFTKEPIEDVAEIKQIVQDIPVDLTGIERAFTAINFAVDQYKSLRRGRGSLGPQRNVLFVVVSDERGDDAHLLESSIDECRKYGIPVYVIGVPAPFGRETTLVKYVDPDPQYDQSPQWAQVDQGPETLFPERVQIDFTGDFKEEPVIDSGFGPYALTRLCYETGGIYFTVHPNRNTTRRVSGGEVDPYASDLAYFFDPITMNRYRPDYLAPRDYVSKVKRSPLRQALISAAQMRPATGLSRPQTRFVKRNDAQLVGDLTRAQQDAARLEPTLVQMAALLDPGMKGRKNESSLRWQAGFDLGMGRVLAQKVRTETYNAMLARAKQGMSFANPKNNTWVLVASDEVSVGSKWQREAETARELLEGVTQKHTGTPWSLLASQELEVPIGWRWEEDFTEFDPARPNAAGNNNNPLPSDDQLRMLNRKEKRPIPKL